MAARKVAVVFGGSGFLGRHLVGRLAASGCTVRVVGRDPEAARFLMTGGMVGQIVPRYADLTRPETLAPAIEGAELVVNLVGILAETTPGQFERVHADGAGAVAAAAAAAGVARLVHVSAIGADPASASRYGASKGRGEQAVRAAFAEASLLRPSLVFGPEDQFFNRFAAMARMLPFLPVICGDTRFQPVYVGDVAAAIETCLLGSPRPGIHELGGPEVASFRDWMRYILRTIDRRRPLLEIPFPIARVEAAVLERLPGRLLTTDQLRMLARDCVVAPGASDLAALGIAPTRVEQIVPGYLARFRPAGSRPAAG